MLVTMAVAVVGVCVVGAMPFLMLGPMSWQFMLLMLYAPVMHAIGV